MEYLERYTIQRLTSSDFHLNFHESLDFKMYLGFFFPFPVIQIWALLYNLDKQHKVVLNFCKGSFILGWYGPKALSCLLTEHLASSKLRFPSNITPNSMYLISHSSTFSFLIEGNSGWLWRTSHQCISYVASLGYRS